jgi:hypothetical protein
MRKPADRSHAVGGAHRLGHRIGEQRHVGIEDEGQLRLVPERVHLGDVGDVETARLQAVRFQQHLQQVEHREHVPMGLIEAGAMAESWVPLPRPWAGAWMPRSRDKPPRLGKTVGMPHHLGDAHRFPETGGNADPGRIGATADGVARVVLPLSSWSKVKADSRPPELRGSMQDQQMSVMGLGNLPGQVGPAQAGTEQHPARHEHGQPVLPQPCVAFITCPPSARRSQQPLALLRHQGRHLADAQALHQQPLLVEVHAQVEALHEVDDNCRR